VRALLAPLAAAYALAGALTAPFLYYALSDVPSRFYAPGSQNDDLVNFVVPTRLTAVGGHLLRAVSDRFVGSIGEQGAYLGIPSLLIVALYARRSWRTPGGRFLIATLGATIVVALGSWLRVAGTSVVPLPWRLVQSLPVVEN